MESICRAFYGSPPPLAELVEASGATAAKVNVRNDYAYVTELNTMSPVVDGKRPSVGQISAHIGAVVRENSGMKRAALCLSAAVGLFALPNVLAKRLAAVRIDPFPRASDALAPQARLFCSLDFNLRLACHRWGGAEGASPRYRPQVFPLATRSIADASILELAFLAPFGQATGSFQQMSKHVGKGGRITR